MNGTMICAECRRAMPFYEFSVADGSIDKRSAICKGCALAWAKGEGRREEALDEQELEATHEARKTARRRPGRKKPQHAKLAKEEDRLALNATAEFCYRCGFVDAFPFWDLLTGVDTLIAKGRSSKIKWYCLNHYPEHAMKLCSVCLEMKPRICFSPDNTRRDGRRKICKPCTNKAGRDYCKRMSPELMERRAAKRRLVRANKTPDGRALDNAKRRARMTPEKTDALNAKRRAARHRKAKK